MRLSLIGMSGTGKSYWAQKLVERGFKRFCCDSIIAERLDLGLSAECNVNQAMGAWMGFPFEAHYQKSAEIYLHYEVEVLEEILHFLETHPEAENVIIDTTGSVIYTGQLMLERLAQQTHMIYLDTPQAVQDKMRTAYLANPAPVLWQNQFNKRPDESNEEALARCYPELLASRTVEYKRWAEITLDYHLLRQPNFTVTNFLAEVERSLALEPVS